MRLMGAFGTLALYVALDVYDRARPGLVTAARVVALTACGLIVAVGLVLTGWAWVHNGLLAAFYVAGWLVALPGVGVAVVWRAVRDRRTHENPPSARTRG